MILHALLRFKRCIHAFFRLKRWAIVICPFCPSGTGATGCSMNTTIVRSKPHWIPETHFYLVHLAKRSGLTTSFFPDFVQKCPNIGMLECRSIGALWGVPTRAHPFLHHSIAPSLHYSTSRCRRWNKGCLQTGIECSVRQLKNELGLAILRENEY